MEFKKKKKKKKQTTSFHSLRKFLTVHNFINPKNSPVLLMEAEIF